MTRAIPLKQIIGYGALILVVFLIEITLQEFSLNGYVFLGGILALLAMTAKNRPAVIAMAVFYLFSLYFFYAYSFYLSLAVSALTLLIAVLSHQLTIFIPYPWRFWLTVLFIFIGQTLISFGAAALNLIPFYSAQMALMVFVSIIMIAASLRFIGEKRNEIQD
jgi:hypothetical protein